MSNKISFSKKYNVSGILAPSSIFHYDEVSNSNEDDDYVLDKIVHRINHNKTIMNYIKNSGIKDGDIVCLECYGEYRNDGSFYYDGKKVIRLGETEDEYGHVPSTSFIEKFPHKKYFSKSVYHNIIVHIDGASYKIEKVKKISETEDDDYDYAYKIYSDKWDKTWIILSPKNRKQFQKTLNKGYFMYEPIADVQDLGSKYLYDYPKDE